MIKEYTVDYYKPWLDKDDQPMTDNHGNIMATVTFAEQKSEPVDVRHKPDKNPYQKGAKLSGVIEQYQTRSGKTRLKFSRKQPEQQQMQFGKSKEQSDQIAYLAHEKNATELVRVSQDKDLYETAKEVAAVTQILYAEREAFFNPTSKSEQKSLDQQGEEEIARQVEEDVDSGADVDLSGVPF